MALHTLFNSLRSTTTQSGQKVTYYSLPALEEAGVGPVSKLPVSIRIVLEAVLRNFDGKRVSENDVRTLANWNAKSPAQDEIPFVVARIVLQDFTGVPLLVDLAAMRHAVEKLKKNPKLIEPLVPVDLVVDHSVQVDVAGSADAMQRNLEFEFARNRERYEFLKWGQQAFETFKVVPPGIGIVHQVNLEYLAKGVLSAKFDGETVYYPDTLVGTDSHTTMINGLGIVGWGVGGIEAEAGMLGQPVYFLTPEVVGVHMTGALREGVTATDPRAPRHRDAPQAQGGRQVCRVLRPRRRVAAAARPRHDREHGARVWRDHGLFPGRCRIGQLSQIDWPHQGAGRGVRELLQGAETFRHPDQGRRHRLQLRPRAESRRRHAECRGTETSALPDLKSKFLTALDKPVTENGFGKKGAETAHANVTLNGAKPSVDVQINHGSVLIAAITSCTNTSNPSVMLAAGLLAKKAVERGLTVNRAVKTSLAPGSRVVTDYLDKTGLQPYLDQLGFQIVGYVARPVSAIRARSIPIIDEAITKGDLVAASVLSGNRNFEARVHPSIKANFLMSPPLVVAFALAGKVDIDLNTEPLGTGKDGKPVFLKEIWPTLQEIKTEMEGALKPETFRKLYSDFAEQNPAWNNIPGSTGETYAWNEKSTYIQEPPFFENFSLEPGHITEIIDARPLGIFGDSVTTDHISPAGSFKKTSPAGAYLLENGVKPRNSTATARGAATTASCDSRHLRQCSHSRISWCLASRVA